MSEIDFLAIKKKILLQFHQKIHICLKNYQNVQNWQVENRN